MNYLADGGSLISVPEVPGWVKEVYVTAPEISPKDHVLMQASFQKFCDSGISKTINFANSAALLMVLSYATLYPPNSVLLVPAL